MIVAVLLPTTGRAGQMKARANDLLMQPVPDGAELWLVLSVPSDDKDTLAAANDLQEQWQDSDVTIILAEREPDTTAVQGWNAAYTAVRDVANWLVLGADDIVWHPGWLEAALDVAEESGAQLIGLNDGGHTDINKKAVHYMVSRQFTEDVMGGVMMPPQYKSWRFDRELTERAQAHNAYAPAWKAIAEHMHPDWGKAEMDETYRRAWPEHDRDLTVYQQRKAQGFPSDYEPAQSRQLEPPPFYEPDATDAALKLAAKHGLDLETITGTGTDGRILKADVEAAVEESGE